GAARVPVVEQPRDDLPVAIDATLDLDHSRRTEVGPREFFRPRPHELHRPTYCAGEARGLDRDFASVLAAITGTHVRNDHADAIFRHAKGLGELAAYSPRALRPGPHRQRAVTPFGHRRTRLERHVRNIRNSIRGLERARHAWGH